MHPCTHALCGHRLTLGPAWAAKQAVEHILQPPAPCAVPVRRHKPGPHAALLPIRPVAACAAPLIALLFGRAAARQALAGAGAASRAADAMAVAVVGAVVKLGLCGAAGAGVPPQAL